MFSIGPIDKDSFGTYKCLAARSSDGQNRTTEIYFALDSPPPPEYVIIRPPQAVVPLGADVTFECLALGKLELSPI